MGRHPKPPELRRRRNKAATASTLSTEAVQAPALPNGISCQETRRWWEVIWASPMAAQWLDSDAEPLLRLALLVDQFWQVPTKELAAEIAKHEARFGLTPLDRMRLQWKLEAAPERRPERTPDDGVDPRALLRAVK